MIAASLLHHYHKVHGGNLPVVFSPGRVSVFDEDFERLLLEGLVQLVDDSAGSLHLLPGGLGLLVIEQVHEIGRRGGQHGAMSKEVLFTDLKGCMINVEDEKLLLL